MNQSKDKDFKRIIVTYPTHPLFLWVYLAVGMLLALLFSRLFSRLPFYLAEGPYNHEAFALASLVAALIALSPLLSFVNLVIRRLSTGVLVNELELSYVEFFGIPVPVPKVRLREMKTLLAINVGGALVPLIASVIFSYLLINSPYGSVFVLTAVIDIVVVTLVTYALSRPMPGVGIVVPAFIPPLTAAFVAIVVSGFGVPAAAAAYIGGSIGSLLGADVLRLLRSYRELTASMLSIGGAGIFDGVFMSGLLAFILAF
ncbi:MAG: DUF1614 domain-containing protein [Acidilobus sp.]|jgi:uncharacterized membrane protein